LADNIRNEWKKAMVEMEDNIVGLDSAIFTRPEVWVASGHVGGFSDPLVECKECNTRSRADHLLEDVGAVADDKMTEEEMNKVWNENVSKIKCPKCGKSNFTEVRKFNLLVKSNLGNFSGNWDAEPTYLRGESCQGIYLNFKNVLQSTRVKVPFGIAQVGKAFRNEISPRQYIFRRREFEQMEMQYFVHPENELEIYEFWKKKRFDYYVENLKLNPANLHYKDHDHLAFYAKAAVDIEYNFPFGFKELEGIHARGNHDLSSHEKGSGQELRYVDGGTGEKYIPHIVETSVGVDRTFLAVITEFLDQDNLSGEEGDVRTVVRFPKNLAPVKCAVLPLVKNKEEIVNMAEKVYSLLKPFGKVEYDETGTVGKRYRRQDEIGTPVCVTIDFDGLVDNTVTVRDRDTGEQKRLKVEELKNYIFG
jgi:glycyl-tRNA synthetase